MAELAGKIDFIRDRQILGWALDRHDPDLPLRVELAIDSTVLGTVTAELDRDDLRGAGIGTGRHGWMVQIPPMFPISRRSVVRARYAGGDGDLERSGEPATQLVVDASIAFDDDQSPWDVLARHDPTWEWMRAELGEGSGLAAGSRQANIIHLRSGIELAQRRLGVLTRLYGPFPARDRALDFGCGTGRLTLPLGRRFEAVVAYDASRHMAAFAAGNCLQENVLNVVFCHAPAALPKHIDDGLDLVLALGVLPHVEPVEGLRLITQMVGAMKDGARGCIDLIASSLGAEGDRAADTRALEFGNDGTVIVGFHPYDLNAVSRVLHEGGIRDLHVESEMRGRHLWWTLYFCKGRHPALR